jgi:membrane protein DedA with SNARE-associated domain
MRAGTLALLVPWVIAHGYSIFFLAALIEGSLVSTAAGVAAALGFFNVFIIIFISICGDVFADVFYYWIGHRNAKVLNSKFFRYIGVTEERIKKVKDLLHTHINKSLILIKLSPFMGAPGLLIVGAVHVPFKRFFKSILIISIIKAFFFVLLGYFSGIAYLQLSKIIANTQSIIIVTFIIFAVYFAYRLITKEATKEISE